MFTFSVLLLISCTACKTQSEEKLSTGVEKTENIMKVVEGRIAIIGNEPFTKLGLVVNDSTIYQLKCDEETKDLLWKNQGEAYKIFVDKLTKSNEGTKIDVSKVEKITN